MMYYPGEDSRRKLHPPPPKTVPKKTTIQWFGKEQPSHLQVIKQRNEGDHVVKSLLNKLMQRPSGQERAVQSQYEDLRIKPMIATHFQRRVNGNVHKQIPGPVSKTNSRKKRMSGRSAAKPVCRSHALILHAPQLMAPNSPQNG